MKKKLLFLFTVIFTLVLLAVGLTLSASAATYADDAAAIAGGAVCRIGAAGTGSYYPTLNAALSEAKDGDTVTFIADTAVVQETVNKKLTFTSENGSTVSGSQNNVIVIGEAEGAAGDLTISGNLKLALDNKHQQVIQMIRGKVTIKENADLTAGFDTVNLGSAGIANEAELVIEGGTIHATDATATDKGAVYVAIDGAKFTMTGGTIEGLGAAFRLGGKKSEVLISGGLITAKLHTVICFRNCGGKFEMSGGTVKTTEGNQAFYFMNEVNTLTFTLTGGLVESAAENALFCGSSDDCVKLVLKGGTVKAVANTVGLSANGETLTISDDVEIIATGNRAISITRPNQKVTISGGKITATTNTLEFRSGGSQGSGGTVKITGGTMTATDHTVFLFSNTLKAATVEISGGTFTSLGSKLIQFAAESKDGDGNPVTTKVNFIITGGEFTASDEIFSILSNSEDAQLIVSGGTFVTTANKSGAVMIRNEGCLTITDGLFVDRNTSGKIFMTLSSSSIDGTNGKLLSLGGRFLFPDNVTVFIDDEKQTKTQTGLTATFDADKNGQIDAGETYNLFLAVVDTDAALAGTLEKGAAVRTVANASGMKFTATFSAETVGNAAAKAGTTGTVTYGMMILPVTAFDKINALTYEQLSAVATNLTASATGGAALTTDESGTKTLQGAITDITDFNALYVAIPYILIIEGETKTCYFTAMNAIEDARSVIGVATAALADQSAGYTAGQIEILNGYLMPVVALLPTGKEEYLFAVAQIAFKASIL